MSQRTGRHSHGNHQVRQKRRKKILKKVSQREKHQYSIITHIYGIQKDGNDDPICKTAKKTQM